MMTISWCIKMQNCYNNIMHKPIINQQICTSRSVPFKTLTFQISQSTHRASQVRKFSHQKVQNARVKTTGIGRNLEIVLKLSEIYTAPNQIFESKASNPMSCSYNFSPLKKIESASPTRRQQIKSAIMRQQRKQQNTNINFSPLKSNNYKFFPKREVKLKNNNPYKFYMFNCRSMDKNMYSQRRQKQLRIQNVCTFVRDPTLPRKAVSMQAKHRRQNPYLEPWNQNRDQGRDDQLIF